MRYLLSVILIFSINLKAESPFSEKPEAGEFILIKYILCHLNFIYVFIW